MPTSQVILLSPSELVPKLDACACRPEETLGAQERCSCQVSAMLSFCCELEAAELVVMSPHTQRVE